MESEKLKVWRTIAEKRRIVELTFQSGQTVSQVARAEGINRDQVFQWRKAYKDGRLVDPTDDRAVLLPVVVSGKKQPHRKTIEKSVLQTSHSAIHIELPGQAVVRIESGTDAALVRVLLEALRL